MGAKKLSLNVNRQNQAAHFYQKAGFSITATEDIDIGNGYYMNDYIMEKDLQEWCDATEKKGAFLEAPFLIKQSFCYFTNFAWYCSFSNERLAR